MRSCIIRVRAEARPPLRQRLAGNPQPSFAWMSRIFLLGSNRMPNGHKMTSRLVAFASDNLTSFELQKMDLC